MQFLLDSVQRTGPTGLLQLLLLLVSSAGAGWVGTRLLSRQRVSIAIMVVPMTWLVLAGIAGSSHGAAMGMQAVADASAETKQALIAAGASTSLSSIALSAVVFVPALLGCVLAGVAASQERPGLSLPALGAVVALLGLALGANIATDTLYFSLSGVLRLLVYAICGAACLAGMGSDRPVSRAAGAVCASSLAIAVAAGEACFAALQHIMTFEAVAHASAESKASMLAAGLDWTRAATAWSGGAVMVAVGLAVCATWRAGKELDDGSLGSGVALAAVLVSPAALLVDAVPVLELIRSQF